MLEIINVRTEVLSYERESRNHEDVFTNINCTSNHLI